MINNTLNAKNRKRDVEYNRQPSLTIPEQSMSIKQIIDRFTRGLPVHAKNYEPKYYGDVEMPNLKAMDLAEQQEMREYAKDKVKEYQDKINRDIAAKREAEAKEFNDWKAQKEEQKNNPTTSPTEIQKPAD